MKIRLRTLIGFLVLLIVLLSAILGLVAYNQAMKIKVFAGLNGQISHIQLNKVKAQSLVDRSVKGESVNLPSLLDSLQVDFQNITDGYVLRGQPKVESIKENFERELKTLKPLCIKYSVLRASRSTLADSLSRYAQQLVLTSGEITASEQSLLLEFRKNIEKYIEQPAPAVYTDTEAAEQLAKRSLALLQTDMQMRYASQILKIQNVLEQLVDIDALLGFSSSEGVRGNIHVQFVSLSQIIDRLAQLSLSKTEHSYNNALVSIFVVFLLLFLLLAVFVWVMATYVAKPIDVIRNYMVELVKGKLPEPLPVKNTDGIGDMAVFLNRFVQSLKMKADFADEIGKGKLNAIYEPLSNEDILGNSLLEMEKSLQRAENEDRKYKLEEQKRIWANEGLARFSEILRLNSHNLQILSDEIIRNLVQYLNAGLGGLFLVTGDEERMELELTSAFAYDRKKYIKSTIKPGEGLVGTCALEKQTIFVTDLPEGYVQIRSGLGESVPKSLLIVPLKLEDTLLGIIELGSFKIFENQEVEFAEKIAESIASTISTVRINARTAELLEQSQKQAEEMAEQEEEMRQNMEELQATQEESVRHEQEFHSILAAFHSATMVAELDINGKLQNANELLLDFLSIDRISLLERNLTDWVALDERASDWRNALNQCRMGKTTKCLLPLRIAGGSDSWLDCSLSPIVKDNTTQRILVLMNNASQKVNSEKDLENCKTDIEEIQRLALFFRQNIENLAPVCELLPGGRIDKGNSLFLKLISLNESELLSRKISNLIVESSWMVFDNHLRQAFKGVLVENETEMVLSSGTKSIKFSLYPVRDSENNIERVIMICR
jgi:PAS domain-containing protein/HAMP domain-containing protein